MSLTAAEIEAVLAELQPLVGAALQKVWSASTRTVVLRLRAPGATHDLFVCAEPGRTRLHRVRTRPRGSGSHLQEALRADVVGLFLQELIQDPPGDRVVRLTFAGPEGTRTLICELFGRRGNLILLGDGEDYRARAGTTRPSTSRFSPGEGFAVNEAVEDLYAGADETAAMEDAQRRLRKPLRRAERRYRRALAKMDTEEASLGDAERYRHLGELLKTQLGRLKRGMDRIEVTDWLDGQPVVIELRPKLGPKENLERIFKLHRKARDAPARIQARRTEMQAQLADLEEVLAGLEAAPDPAAVEALDGRAKKHVRLPGTGRRGKGSAPRLPYWRFESTTGHRILVGRGAKDNHALTFAVAKGSDVWLHVRGTPGSHVVVPTGGKGECDEQTLLDAAHLAVHYSKSKGEPLVEVGWTLRKHVSHPRGAPPGRVTTAKLRNLLLRTEPYRLSGLLATKASE